MWKRSARRNTTAERWKSGIPVRQAISPKITIGLQQRQPAPHSRAESELLAAVWTGDTYPSRLTLRLGLLSESEPPRQRYHGGERVTDPMEAGGGGLRGGVEGEEVTFF
ncbi:unnamed protein product [Pleuronectes platessa]|uniref:Uncharacterized protein n=1 Tax=Pleuronectes platessa TaxID=8262 RepID=A0A9N7VLR8_PLEPL|nr:unnamed protein product [Pleuronectes platessa]